jgi:3-dehydroquinate dehydratase-2
MKILVLHGPNLNSLGSREPTIYGRESLNEINHQISEFCDDNITVDIFQSNIEGEIINKLYSSASDGYMYGVFNLAAYTHTSIAIRDAIISSNFKFIEVHLSNIYKRENFRHKSLISDIAIGVISGLGVDSYLLALKHLNRGD